MISNGEWAPFWADITYEAGTLLAKNGYADKLRYADMGKWTGDPIPNPTTCSGLGSILPCGGSCGACPAGSVCRGRSPLHPVGFCDPDGLGSCVSAPGSCNAGLSCFTYLVQPEVQAQANAVGTCLPTADCHALAQAIPGGGKCAP